MSYKNTQTYQIQQIGHLLTSQSDQILLERFGIGFSQFKVLLCLEERSGVPQKYIAQTLFQTEASISRQINVLFKKGLVLIKSGKDNRQNLIYPTSRGVEVIAKASKALRDYDDPVYEHLSVKQQKFFKESIDEIYKYLTS